MANMTFGTNLIPASDNTYTLGNSNKNWKIYGTVNDYTVAAASAKSVDTSISVNSISTNLPTSTAVANFTKSSLQKMQYQNLFINTKNIDISSSDKYPKIINQDTETAFSDTLSAATHGLRSTVISTSPAIRFGTSTVSQGSMNGLIAGETYTWSFDYDIKVYSGTISSLYNVRAYLYYVLSETSSFATDADNYDNIVTYDASTVGTRKTGSFSLTFTVPATAIATYLIIRPQNTTSTCFAEGDYLEISNICLVKGSIPMEYNNSVIDEIADWVSNNIPSASGVSF